MGILYNQLTLGSLATIIIFTGVCLLINEATRRSKAVGLIIFGLLPFILAGLVYLGYLGSPTGKTWFGWVKVVSALIGVYGFMLIRYTKLGRNKFAMYFPVTILALNIAEAVYREFEVFATYKEMVTDASGVVMMGGYWNVFNAIAGIITIITLTGFVGIMPSKAKNPDMVWPDMTWLYIWGYTLWNFAYVYNCISTRSMYAGFGILTAAILAEYFFKQGVWLQHRAQILTVYAMFSLSVDYQASPLFQVVPVYKQSMWWTVSLISFTFNMGVLAYMIYTMIKYKRNPLKEALYTHTSYYQKTLEDNHLIVDMEELKVV
ncbi:MULTISPECIES: DUF5692 family protein [unclassified Fusibacter]|uniref:DUF5692 family protein n=1 Tax=unclassified Fusibacter TaxID=2624464 RepID=UPI0010121CCC|nr:MULTISPECIES: DUF5692 family protein [unclassified Fusibacter]MCK8060742.1 DUF5692 family protein [Fusibacter sp. A2]NPE23038.1 hypothetical protein [Fusibacter sp. A1]RXV59711.1 hypothetical protein DWB64_14445 [Fusibacter sp. A1]